METAKMRNSVTMVLLMVMSTFAAIEIPRAEASEVVLTDAIQIVNGGSANDRMVATDADSMGNVHFVWSRNTQHMWYQMHNPRGDVLISETQISNPGAHRAWHPDISVDSDDNLHITLVHQSHLTPYRSALKALSDAGELPVPPKAVLKKELDIS